MELQLILNGPFLKAEAGRVADWVGRDARRFKQLMEYMLGEEPRLAARAAWAVSHCCERQPMFILPYQEPLLYRLQENTVSDAVKRNAFRLLQQQDLSEPLWGLAADLGFRYLDDPQQPPAVRVFAMSLLGRLCRHVPELSNELRLTIETHWEHATPAFRARGRRVLLSLQD